MSTLGIYQVSAARRRRGRRAGALLATVSLAMLCQLTNVASEELWPQTRIKLTVMQWVPLKGTYERLDAFSGDFMISADGNVPLPVIGQIPTLDKTSDEVAHEVATALKDRLGLVDAPETSIDVLSYAPIYVVGDVSVPGSFEFRQGMTVLQAFALGGGERQDQASGTPADRLRLASELRSMDSQLLRSRARVARLRAEADELQSIVFPKEVTDHPDIALAQTAMSEEESIFQARRREVVRQTEALDELVVLLNEEIDTLKTRLSDLDQMMVKASDDLTGVEALVEKGFATASRRSELERQVSDMRFDQLTQTTAILRAQQALSQSQREATQLQDARRVDAALAIQQEQAKIDQLVLQQSTSQRLLLDLDVGPGSIAARGTELQYRIVRQSGGGPEISADETTVLLPGDVLKVSAGVTGEAPTTSQDLAEIAQ